MEKIITIKTLQMEKVYREFYEKIENQNLKHVFFMCDHRLSKVNDKSSKIS
jgi:hypothetical protein